tara:strand:+ start:391 stop:1191 length:801 start_codon:yes stop_codon:yes gene_type:complete
MKKVLFLRNQKTSSSATLDLSTALIGSQENIQLACHTDHNDLDKAIEKHPEFKNAFKFVNIRNPYGQAVSQMFKNLWGDGGSGALKFDNDEFTTKSMNMSFKLEHAVETFQLITRVCYDLKYHDQLKHVPHGEHNERVESYIKQASCEPVKGRLERLDWIHTYRVNAHGVRGWRVYTLNDKPAVDHYLVFNKQRQSWAGLLNKLFDKSTADELFNSDLLQNHFVRSEEYRSKYDFTDFYTPEIKKMVRFLRQPEIDYHKWKFNNNN